LGKIDGRLHDGYREESQREEALTPVRKPHVDERFRGLPISLGWLAVFLASGLWIAGHAYNRQSIFLSIMAVFTFAAAIPGSVIVLFG
jgi:hypothetical protein